MDAISLARNTQGKRMKTAVMKTLKQFLITGTFIILASAIAFAQKNDDQKKPPKPKDNPPVVVVPKDGKKPKDNEKPPKKPREE
jgi:hypothetical protein